MELGIIVGLATWGYHAGQTLALKLLLAIGAPLVIFSFWSLFDFRGVVPNPEPYRLLQELALSGLAAIAWIAAGRRTLGCDSCHHFDRTSHLDLYARREATKVNLLRQTAKRRPSLPSKPKPMQKIRPQSLDKYPPTSRFSVGYFCSASILDPMRPISAKPSCF